MCLCWVTHHDVVLCAYAQQYIMCSCWVIHHYLVLCFSCSAIHNVLVLCETSLCSPLCMCLLIHNVLVLSCTSVLSGYLVLCACVHEYIMCFCSVDCDDIAIMSSNMFDWQCNMKSHNKQCMSTCFAHHIITIS